MNTERPVQHPDVVTTVLAETIGDEHGRQGGRLRKNVPNRAVVERGPLDFSSIPLDSDILKEKFSPDHRYGVAADDMYQVFDDRTQYDGFDIGTGEQRNLLSEDEAMLRAAFKSWRDRVHREQYSMQYSEVDGQTRARLRELGYIVD